MTISNILIYGYGVMGQAVAGTFAANGFRTVVKTRQEFLPELAPANVVFVRNLPTEPPDLVIEFVPEDVATKRAVYDEIETTYAGHNVIVATGTSGLDLTQLADGLKRPELFIGIHYFMPAEKTTIVEVMAGPNASSALVDSVAELLILTKKEPLRIYRPVVGFIVNRLQHAILHEAYYLIEQGFISALDIDRAAMKLLAPRMCLNGLLQQKDISGLRIHADAQRSIVPTLYHNGIPNSIPQNLINKGESGLDAGRGFYDWTGLDVRKVRKETSQQLEHLMNFLDSVRARIESEYKPGCRKLS
jgi:3-hydroxybutyryl-CoA dehydrogenase